jgi:methyltransferase (TIGR00027 family)
MDGRASTTAMRVAMRRAAHQLLDDPLVFEDPLAIRILGPEMQESLRAQARDRQSSRFLRPRLRAHLVARSRFCEEELGRATASGVTQYVILGAGFDTSAYRTRSGGERLRIFEVDHPDTQRSKREALARAGIAEPGHVAFVPVDFEEQSLADELRNAGFQTERPAFFSWLGVVPYLRRAAIEASVRFIGSLPAGTGVVFDYSLPPETLPFLHRFVRRWMARPVAVAGEPFLSYFTPKEIASLLQGAGFSNIVDLDGPAINSHYFSGRKDRLRVGGVGHLVCATVLEAR